VKDRRGEAKDLRGIGEMRKGIRGGGRELRTELGAKKHKVQKAAGVRKKK